MNIEKILEYQKIDQEVYRAELEFKRSKEIQRLNGLQAQINNIAQSIVKLDKEAEELFNEIEKLDGLVGEAVPHERGALSYNAVSDPVLLKNAEKVLAGYTEALNNFEREISKSVKRLNDIKTEALKLNEQGRSCSAEHQKVRNLSNEKKNQLLSSVKDKIEILNALRNDIDPKLFSAYKERRDNNKMPALVMYTSGNCSACGMFISAEVGEKMHDSGDVAECPNCRRLVYLK